MITDQQKELRKNGIGASDSPIIAGYSTYKTSRQLYHEKRGEIIEPEEAGEAAECGNLLEDAIAEIFTRKTSIATRKSNQTIFHPEIHFMFTHLDRTTPGGIPLEIKNTVKAEEWGPEEDGPEGVPIDHNIQVQHQIFCTGKDRATIAALFFGNRLKVYEIPRDNEWIEMIIELNRKFWDCVETGIPPEPTYTHPTTVDLLKRLHPGTNGKKIVLPENILNWHSVLQEAQEIVKKYEIVTKHAKAHILHSMGDSAVGLLEDGTTYTRKLVKKKAFEVKATEYIDFRHTNKPPKG